MQKQPEEKDGATSAAPAAAPPPASQTASPGAHTLPAPPSSPPSLPLGNSLPLPASPAMPACSRKIRSALPSLAASSPQSAFPPQYPSARSTSPTPPAHTPATP